MQDRISVVNITVAVEGILILIATAWMFWGQINLEHLFHFSFKALWLGLALGLIVVAGNCLLLFFSQKWREKAFLFRSFHDLIEKELLPLFGQLKLQDTFLLAIASGIAEELFFRGVVEEESGIYISSLTFGLAHMPRFYYFPYALQALFIGLLMSFVKYLSGSLYAPIIAHSLINFLGLNLIMLLHKRKTPDA